MTTEDILEIILLIIMMHELRECLNVISSEGRRFWVRPLYRDRDTSGFFAVNFDEMYNNNAEQFKETVRMSKEVFDLLLSLVKEDLTKHSNRPSISPKCRLFLTLAYLAHGGSKQMFSATFKMGLTTVKRIVGETCEVLWDTLGFVYLIPPKRDEWQRIANDFYSMWNFPNCVGAIDAKHINLTCSSNSGSYNNKGKYSIVLLAACDANYTFTNIDIGASNSKSDGSVLWQSNFGQQLFNGQLGLPEDIELPGTDMQFPYFMVGDAAFPLKTCLMRPYPGNHLPPEREIFNKRLSRVRRVIENAFGVLATRWRILLSPLNMSPSSAEKIVKATVLLHNFLTTHDVSYCPPEYVDQYEGENIINGDWRQEVSTPLQSHGRMTANNASKSAFKLRDNLMNYVNSDPI